MLGSDMIGKYVVVRTYSAGVHVGTLKARDGREVILGDARRIWSWEGAFTLSAVATAGVAKTSRLSVEVPEILVTEAIEIMPCSEAAAANLRGLKAHE